MKSATVFLILIGVVYCAVSPQVGGTTCSDAVALNVGANRAPISIFDSNTRSTPYVENNVCDFSSTSSGTVWYSISVPSGVHVNVTTCSPDTDFDTIISIYQGTCNRLTCSTFNDDNCISSSSASTLDFISNGEPYFIAVSGYSSSNGNYELIIGAVDPTNSPACTSVLIPNQEYTKILGSNAKGLKAYKPSCGIDSSSKVVWYQLSTTPGKDVTLSTCSEMTDFDTVISVFSGDCGGLTCFALNDDSCRLPLNSGASTITFTPVDEIYHIAISGINGAEGSFELIVTTITNTPFGGCQGAQSTIINAGDSNEIFGSNSNAQEFSNTECGATGPASFYKFQVDYDSPSGTFSASTCSYQTNFDTYLSVYSGSCDDLLCLGDNDDGYCALFVNNGASNVGGLMFNAGDIFYVVVTGYSGATGDFELSWAFDGEAANPELECNTAESIDLSGEYGGTPRGFVTGSTGLLSASTLDICGGETGPADWYLFTSTTPGSLSLSTCNPDTTFDTQLYAYYYESSCSELQCNFLDDDTSFCVFGTLLSTITGIQMDGTQSVYVMVSGYNGAFGDYSLEYNFVQENSQSSSCTEASSSPIILNNGTSGSVEGTLVGSTIPAEVICGFEVGQGDWYSFIAESGGDLIFTTCTENVVFDTQLYLYTGTCDALSCGVYNDDSYCPFDSLSSTIVYPIREREQVFVVVHGYQGATGSYELAYELTSN